MSTKFSPMGQRERHKAEIAAHHKNHELNETIVSLRAELVEIRSQLLATQQDRHRIVLERDTALRELGAMARRVAELERGLALTREQNYCTICGCNLECKPHQRAEELTALLRQAQREWMTPGQPSWERVDQALAPAEPSTVEGLSNSPANSVERGKWNRSSWESGWTIKHCGETCWMEPETKFFCCGVCGKVYQRPEETDVVQKTR